MPRNVERTVAVTADGGQLLQLIVVQQIGPREVAEIKQVAVDQLSGKVIMTHHRECLGVEIAVGDKSQRPQLDVYFPVRRLAMIDRQERNLGLDGDSPRKQPSAVMKDDQFRALNVDLEQVDPFNFGYIVQSARLQAAAPLNDLAVRPEVAV
jgi:hypothetical protein